ncbi:5870_t:CDS:2, partial [Funneliformis geosporum]
MSNKNFSKRPYYEINSDLEKNTLNEELNLDKESSELLEKSNSILSLLDENDKKNKSAVWDHFDKFVDNKEEWNHIKELYRIFEIFHKATEEMSKSQYVTLSSLIPIYNVLLDHLEKLLDSEYREFYIIPKVRTAIAKVYEKLKTYYPKTDQSIVYPIATKFIDNALKIVSDTYNKYYRDNSLVANDPAQDQNKSNFFGLFEIGNDSSDEDELEEYLLTYPHLATMAQDFLAIPVSIIGTSVPVEQ